jgi:hypothetical protein
MEGKGKFLDLSPWVLCRRLMVIKTTDYWLGSCTLILAIYIRKIGIEQREGRQSSTKRNEMSPWVDSFIFILLPRCGVVCNDEWSKRWAGGSVTYSYLGSPNLIYLSLTGTKGESIHTNWYEDEPHPLPSSSSLSPLVRLHSTYTLYLIPILTLERGTEVTVERYTWLTKEFQSPLFRNLAVPPWWYTSR